MSSNSGGKTILGVVIAVVIVGVSIFYFADRGYGKVSSGTYDVASALYAACLAKSDERLNRIELLLNGGDEDSPGEKPELTEKEAEWLSRIIRTARGGKWEKAARSARRIMEDQVEY